MVVFLICLFSVFCNEEIVPTGIVQTLVLTPFSEFSWPMLTYINTEPDFKHICVDRQLSQQDLWSAPHPRINHPSSKAAYTVYGFSLFPVYGTAKQNGWSVRPLVGHPLGADPLLRFCCESICMTPLYESTCKYQNLFISANTFIHSRSLMKTLS